MLYVIGVALISCPLMKCRLPFLLLYKTSPQICKTAALFVKVR